MRLTFASNPTSFSSDTTIREREIVKKGIARLEKQIEQLILVDVSSDNTDISLIKKCKTVDVPGIHSAIGHIQKSLQKYVNFQGMDEDYCDVINDLMDRVVVVIMQIWLVDPSIRHDGSARTQFRLGDQSIYLI